jgi:hypothetical protein
MDPEETEARNEGIMVMTKASSNLTYRLIDRTLQSRELLGFSRYEPLLLEAGS